MLFVKKAASSKETREVTEEEVVQPEDWDKVDWHRIEPERGSLRASKILHLIPENGIHLDIGVGRGDGTYLISKMKKCIGFDYGFVSTKIAKKRGLVVCQADARSMPFKSNTFGSVTCLDVLEHVPNPEFVIREIHRVLKDDGILILQTPIQEMLKERFLHFLRKHKIKDQKQPYDSPLKLKEVRAILIKNHTEIISEKKIKIWASNPLIRALSYSKVFYCQKRAYN